MIKKKWKLLTREGFIDCLRLINESNEFER